MGISSSLLLNHLKGKKTFLGSMVFKFAGEDFRLMRIATGGGIGGVGGTYPVLENYSDPCQKLIIGSETSGKFAKGKFLILPRHKILQIREMNVLVGTDDESLMVKIENGLKENPFIVPVLFNKPFSHLTISSRIDVGGWKIFQRKTVLSYTGLPESIYENPQEFEIFLKSVLLLKHHIFKI